jgi:DnaK suppressor protein
MLFVSLLQGLGLFPGKAADPARQQALDVQKAPQSPSRQPSRGITRKDAEPSPVGAAQRQRRPAVKKTVAAAPTQPKAKAKVNAPVAEVAVPAKAKAKAPAKKSTPPQAVAPTPPVKPTPSTAKAKPAPKKPAAVTPPPVPQPVSAPVVAAAPKPVADVAPVSRRGGSRKAAAAPLPTPQPVPSHSPDAAKATFSPINQRVMTAPVHSPVRKDPKLANNWKTKPVDQLTDEEVLAMPEAEYMNDAQMAFFRLKLVRLKEDILTNAGETTEHLREDTVVVPDPADRATIEEEHALELRTRDRERKLLKKIEQSIARIDAGDYGYCDETGEPIGVGRLLARPTASLSLEAQQRRELKQKMFGD